MFAAKKVSKLLATPLLVSLIAATGHGQSALDGFDPNANGTVRIVVVQSDGKILLGGDFTTLSPNGGTPVTRPHLARLNPDGTLDPVFDPNPNNSVESIALQADGKILVGGSFNGANSIGGQTRNYIARLDATTGLADSFDPNADSLVNSIAVQADGKVLAAGAFTSIGGQTRNYIARLDATAGLADSFDPNAGGSVLSITVQADGKILAGGAFTHIGGQLRHRIARLDAATGLADSFNPNASGRVLSIAVQADGKILAGGEFSGPNSIGGQTRHFIARLDATTGLADSFNPNADDDVHSVALQADGKILAGGYFTNIGGETRQYIARLDATTGSADLFNSSADNGVLSIAVQADGKILSGGHFTMFAPNGGAPVTRNGVARLETDGRVDQTLDLSIGTGKFGIVFATAVQADGKILLGGRFSSVLGVARNFIARLNTDGTLDPSFDPNPDSLVESIGFQADGKILVGGMFGTIGGEARNHFARLNATTGLADSFRPNVNNDVRSITVQADGRILVGGPFDAINGQWRNHIARLDFKGAPDSFNPQPYGTVESIATQADGKILAGGAFTSIGGQSRNHLARLEATIGVADWFDPSPAGDVFTVAVQPDGKVLAGGFVLNMGGQKRNGLARVDGTTGLVDAFNPNANSLVDSIAVHGDGKILASGHFSGANSIGGQTRNFIARLDATTGAADSFDPNANGAIHSIATQADGKILAGGAFTSMGGEARFLFARLSNDTAALQNLAVTKTTITWTRGGSSPQFTRATFEYSIDKANYTPLGNGSPAGNNWTLTGLSRPTGENIYIRARGYYHSGWRNGSESITESVRNAFFIRPATLGNISTRLQVGTDDRVAIAGFIVRGSSSKRVLIRAAGPSLAKLGVRNVLPNPQLALNDSTSTIGRNDDWQTTQIGGLITSDQVAEIQASGLAPGDPSEAAIVAALPPGSYTVIVQGVNDGTGVGIVEVYDLDATSSSLLANISTRGFVQTGDDVMIGGFVVVTQPTRVIIRAIGPSLSQFGVPDTLANPQVELHNTASLIGQNNDWQTTQLGGIITSDQAAEIQNSQLAPTHPAESAIIATLPPGSYTAIVRGVDSTTGNALVEVYALP